MASRVHTAPIAYSALVGVVTLGCGFTIQSLARRIARPDDLAGLTAVFYSVSYLGFGTPALPAFIHGTTGVGYPAMPAAGALIALGCLAPVLRNYRAPTR